jgi:hypothetical protein
LATTMKTSLPLLVLQIHQSRVLWRALQPLLWSSDSTTGSTTARVAVQCLLEQCFASCLQRLYSESNTEQHCPPSEWNDSTDSLYPQQRRRIRNVKVSIPSIHRRNRNQLRHNCDCRISGLILWLHPPLTTRLEYTFTGLLLRWEHVLIKAQSLSGYIATLGGGFFLCHHFATAYRLAQWQQQLAILLNDVVMYYTCAIHQAYSHVYAGHFGTAKRMLQQIESILLAHDELGDDTTSMANRQSAPSPRESAPRPHKYPVLIQMCHSASLFCRRMRRTARNKGTCTRHKVSTMDSSSTWLRSMDDLQRIRVVRDKSQRNDLVIPFASCRASW